MEVKTLELKLGVFKPLQEDAGEDPSVSGWYSNRKTKCQIW